MAHLRTAWYSSAMIRQLVWLITFFVDLLPLSFARKLPCKKTGARWRVRPSLRAITLKYMTQPSVLELRRVYTSLKQKSSFCHVSMNTADCLMFSAALKTNLTRFARVGRLSPTPSISIDLDQ